MAGKVEIDERFLEPFESMMLAMETAQIPLVIMCRSDASTFASGAVAALGGTVVYTSQPDFVQQTLASITGFDYLFSVIDEPLAPESYKLVRAYLAARDIMGPDESALGAHFGASAPHVNHRLILIVDQAVFDAHDHYQRRELADLCRVIAVS